MKGLDVLTPAARDYLNEVHRGLADLAVDDQTELLSQVEQRLIELDRDPEDSATIDGLLGNAQQFAADLRSAAGLPPRTLPDDTRPAPSTADWLREVSKRPAPQAVLTYLRDLRPAWWALRGYLLVALVLAVLSQGGGYQLHTFGGYSTALTTDGPGHASSLWVLVTVAAMLASIFLGRLTRALPRSAATLVIALDMAAAFTFFAYPTWWLGPAFRAFSGL